jgi:hypothetical protein
MPPYYDIYGLSRQRDKRTVEKFLNYFSIREKIENREGQEIVVYKNEKYKIGETLITISTLTEVIDFGLENKNFGFAFYIGDNLKKGINHIILKFTFDGKIIFGISVEEKKIEYNGNLIDNYDKAIEVEKAIAELTNATKTSIQFEYAPSDDEEEFDSDIEIWRNMNDEKRKIKST